MEGFVAAFGFASLTMYPKVGLSTNISFDPVERTSNRTLNYLNRSSPETGPLAKADLVIWAALTSLVSIAGVLSCCTVIWVVTKVTVRRNTGINSSGSNLLIINYLFMLLVSVGVNTPIVIYMVVVRQILGHPLQDICVPVQFLNFLTSAGINYVTGSLSIHRIIALKSPRNYAKVTRRPVLFLMILLTWLAALPSNIPYLVGIGGHFALIPGGRCGVVSHNPTIITILFASTNVPFVFSTVTAFFLLGTVLRVQYRVRVRTTPLERIRSAAVTLAFARTRRKRIRLTYTLLVATLIDGLLWKTWDIIGALFPGVYARSPMSSLLSRTSIAMVAVLAPMIICVANTDFRKGLRHFITPWPQLPPQTAHHSKRALLLTTGPISVIQIN